MDLKRFDGDGLGTLPNGKKTPQHSDLVFQVSMVDPCTKGYEADPKRGFVPQIPYKANFVKKGKFEHLHDMVTESVFVAPLCTNVINTL